MSQSRLTGRAIVCTLAEGQRFLIGEFEIDCPGCGTGSVRIAGHHLRGMLRLLAQWVEEYPDLTGPEEMVELSTTRWSGRSGGDPTRN